MQRTIAQQKAEKEARTGKVVGFPVKQIRTVKKSLMPTKKTRKPRKKKK